MPEPASIHRSMTAFEWAQLLGLSVLWACSFFFNAVALKEIPPLTVALLRVALAALILLAVLRAAGMEMPLSRASGRHFSPWACSTTRCRSA